MHVVNLEDLHHGIRVANLSVELAEQINYPKKKIKALYLSGLFHDIGKAYINQEIINSPGTLTKEEKEIIEIHPEYSYKEVLSMGYSDEVALNILYHHENWNGSGYPKGLKGGSIPLGARILRLTDVFDALTMERPYRCELSASEALSIMENEVHNYDPELYSIFYEFICRKYKTQVDKISKYKLQIEKSMSF